jgi:MtN3 and saliva related transmembrane protein
MQSEIVWMGLIAGACTTFAGLPQLIHVARKGSSDDLSPLALGTFTIGLALWLVYGIAIASIPLILWNAVSFAIYLGLVAIKISHMRSGSNSRETL